MAEVLQIKPKLDDIKALPIIDKVIVLINYLNESQIANLQEAGKPAITKQQLLQQLHHKATARAYHNVTVILSSVFKDELKEKLQPIIDARENKETIGNG